MTPTKSLGPKRTNKMFLLLKNVIDFPLILRALLTVVLVKAVKLIKNNISPELKIVEKVSSTELWVPVANFS